MSKYYNPKRTSYLYIPNNKFPFRISRSKIDLFLNCPRCFYYDRRLGLAQPPGYPFSLNSAVDKLLKKEFDFFRNKGIPHPLMKKFKINAIPFKNKNIEKWRDALRGGIEFLYKKTNLLITGGIDDLWINPEGEIMIVDYKATSKEGEINLDSDWQIGYKRQMEVYQWLFKKNGYKVLPTGYFVYCNGKTNSPFFNGKLEFDIKIIPYIGDDSWVDKTIGDMYKCLNSDKIPESGPDCDYCKYRNIEINDYEILIKKGENIKLEFKSSLRYDLQTKLINKTLELVIAKTISAFMNTKGGRLFIGIEDNGNIIGIENDLKSLFKKNEDGFKLKLIEIINQFLGKEYNQLLSVNFPRLNGKLFCDIIIEKSKNPVYLKLDQFEFYTKTEASIEKLDVRASHEYIKNTFSNSS